MTTPSAAETEFTVHDGTKLHRLDWPVEEQPKAVIALVHGYGEHIGRYGHVARRFNEQGYSVHGYDQRGHGRSPGEMGYIPDFSVLISDCGQFIEIIRQTAGNLPFFIMGHSMGGLVVASTVVDTQPKARGIVFSSTALSFGEVAPVLRAVSGLLSALTPRLPVQTLDSQAISRIPEEVRAYQNDPLVHHGKISARTGVELLHAAESIRPRLGEITHPFLALHGGSDRLIPVQASQWLYDEAASEDKTLKIYDGAYHEVFNDLEREQFFSDVLAWIEERVNQ